jgi:hypothetical protein
MLEIIDKAAEYQMVGVDLQAVSFHDNDDIDGDCLHAAVRYLTELFEEQLSEKRRSAVVEFQSPVLK